MTDERESFREALTLPDLGSLTLAKSLLEDADIPYYVKNELTQNLFGWGQLNAGYNFIVGPPVLMVEASRLQEARELLEPLLQGPGATAPATGDEEA
jgi:hypothetical protein